MVFSSRAESVEAAARLTAYNRAILPRRLAALATLAAIVLAVVSAGWIDQVHLDVFFAKFPKFAGYLHRIFILDSGASVFSNIADWFWGIKRWGRLLLETVLVAYLSTTVGALAALFLCFGAAHNLSRSSVIRIVIRRFLEFCRTVPEIVFAMVFVVAFGLGPLPGVVAIAIHSTGALGKLFFEAVENIDMKPLEGVSASGASSIAVIRFAVLPQVMAKFASYVLLRFEINVREAAIMGLVGAGGIGQDLVEAIEKFYYSDVSAILILIIVTVSAIDLVSEHLRHRLVTAGGEP